MLRCGTAIALAGVWVSRSAFAPAPTKPSAVVAAPATAARPLWPLGTLAAGVAATGVGAYLVFDSKAKYRALVEGNVEPSQAIAYRDSGRANQELGYALA